MSVRLYNSLTRQVEDFAPAAPPKVEMFVCGPTVYDLVHIGNARTFTTFDVVAKWLRYRNYAVTYLQNITDVDDKIIKRAAEQNEEPLQFAERFYKEFVVDMEALGNNAVNKYVRATEHIPQVLKQVRTLRDKGHAYLIEGDGWYFDLSTFPQYGKLSGRTSLQADDAVSRIDENPNKRNPGDFVLWKLSKPPSTASASSPQESSGQAAEPSWKDAELGAGRPGWHIEDTAMTEHHFGPQYDLHGGGIDLKFPHHEAEITQQEAASGLVPFVRHWMHAGFLQMSKEKMSKSSGNIITVRDALKDHQPEALRFFFLSSHYRAPLELSDASLTASSAAVQRIGELRDKVQNFVSEDVKDTLKDIIINAQHTLEEAMDDDLNTPRAFAAIFELVSTMNLHITKKGISKGDAERALAFFSLVDDQFGIVPRNVSAPAEIDRLVLEREDARQRKDWTVADTIRERLSEQGWTVDDTPYGPLVKRHKKGSE